MLGSASLFTLPVQIKNVIVKSRAPGGGGISVFLGMMSFVGGLLGWLLVMKKKVLQCTKCGVTVAAG